MSNGQKRQELLEQGYIKVGSKTYCEYWKKSDDIITLYNDNDDAQRLEMEAMRKTKAYALGYEEALKSINTN